MDISICSYEETNADTYFDFDFDSFFGMSVLFILKFKKSRIKLHTEQGRKSDIWQNELLPFM